MKLNDHTPITIDLIPALSCVVQLRMAVTTYELEVVPAERDIRVVNVLRAQVNLVMDDLTRSEASFGQASLTQSALALCVGVTSALPCL